MSSVKVSELKNIIKNILGKCKVPNEDAEIITESIIYANCREKHTHGIAKLPIYARKIKRGLMTPETKVAIVKDSPVISVLDANHGFGQVVGFKGMKQCIEKAETFGIGLVGVRNSNNFGTAGFIVELAANKGMIGVIMGNSAPAIAPWGGKHPLLGTNPLGVAFPSADLNKPPIVLDMATSVVARSKIRLAEKNKEKIPFCWAFNSNGEPTDDPVEALKGTMAPIGEHKGYGLALVIDILAGLLTGSAFGGETKPLNHSDAYSKYGHMIMAININYFMSIEEYSQKIEVLRQNIKYNDDNDQILLPGEDSYNKYLNNADVLDLPKIQLDELKVLAEELGFCYNI